MHFSILDSVAFFLVCVKVPVMTRVYPSIVAVWSVLPLTNTHAHAFTERRALIQSCKRCTYVSHCLWLTLGLARSFTAPLWYRCARAEALGAAWLSFYQILGPFKWMIPLLHRDQQTKSPLFLFSPLLLLLLFLSYPSLKAQLQLFVTSL